MERIKMLNFESVVKVALLLLLPYSIFGQGPAGILPQTTPPSPDAAALGRYGEVPVGTYTGIPEISIPLYDIESDRLRHPVSMSYHAGGIKVEDISSNVGLGWTLNAGGVITRTVVGLPDDKAVKGFLVNHINANMDNFSDFDLKQVVEGKLDTQPDVYYFNFGSYSGKLIFDKLGNCHTIPHHNFKIKPALGPLSNNLNAWEITTEDGTLYIFDEPETTETEEISYDSESLRKGGIPLDAYKKETYISSWYLTKIISPHASNEISFSYAVLPYQYNYDVQSSVSRYQTFDEGTGGCDFYIDCPNGRVIVPCERNYFSYYDSKIKIKGRQLEKISFKGGHVSFEHDRSRQDLPGAPRIKTIVVADYKGNLVKKFLLDNTKYFESGCADAKCKRLKLTSITELGVNTVKKPPFIFEYNSEKLPPRDSYDTDHWGYYNKRGNTAKIPEFIDVYDESEYYDYLPGANKRPDPQAAQAGILTRVIYPTGGYTDFEYELNQAISNRLPFATLPKQVIRIVGDSNTPNQLSDVITIKGYTKQGTVEGLFVKVRYQTSGCFVSKIIDIENNCPALQIVGVGNSVSKLFQSAGGIEETVFFLPNGQYKMKGSGAKTGQSYFLDLSYETEIPINKFAGGLRVKKITDSDGLNALNNSIRRFVYEDADNISTGRLNNYPKYYYNNFHYGFFDCSNGQSLSQVCWLVPTFVRTQESNTTLGNTRGSYVGYGKVIELKGEFGEQGKSEYFYTSVWKSEKENNSIFVDTNINDLPFGPPSQDNDWERGFLCRQIDYKHRPNKEGEPFLPVREVINEYNVVGSGIGIRSTLWAVYKAENPCAPSVNPAEYRSSLIERTGNLSYELSTKTERLYSEHADNFVETLTRYTYSPFHRQVTDVFSALSDSHFRTVRYKYPTDYTSQGTAGNNMSLAISGMKAKHIHTPVIEEQVWETDEENTMLVDAKLNLYYPNGTDLHQQLQLETADPIIDGSYSPSHISSEGLFEFDDENLGKIITVDKYDDTFGKPIQITGRDGIRKSYLWGYEGQYPLVEALNADYNSIAFTSFEENNSGNFHWRGEEISGDSKSGAKHYTGIFSTATAMPAGDYVISFWSRGNGSVQIQGVTSTDVNSVSWERNSVNFSLTSSAIASISSSVEIDEVRVHPKNAMMKSYTYSPSVGLSSISDQANKVQTFEYDELNRLDVIRNHNKDILSKYQYNLSGYKGSLPGSNIDAEFTLTGDLKPAAPITFTAKSTTPNLTFEWDFGDGTISKGERVITHTYNAGGTYFVKLNVRKENIGNYSVLPVKVGFPAATVDTSESTPQITINSLIGTQSKLEVSATAQVTATSSPIKNYLWSINSNSRLGDVKVFPVPHNNPFINNTELDEIVTTTPTAQMSVSLPSVISLPCFPRPTYGYIVKCRIKFEDGTYSEYGTKQIQFQSSTKTLKVSPSTLNSLNKEGGNANFGVIGADGDISVTSDKTWAKISDIPNCTSFTIEYDPNTGPVRSATLTVTSSNGTSLVLIKQDGN